MKKILFIAVFAGLISTFCLGLKARSQSYRPMPVPDPILMHPIGNFANPTASDRQGFSIDSLYERAANARRTGDRAAAVQIYTKIIRFNSQEAQAYFNRGSIRQSNPNDLAGAMADFQTALKLFRQQGNNYMTRASIEHIQQLR